MPLLSANVLLGIGGHISAELEAEVGTTFSFGPDDPGLMPSLCLNKGGPLSGINHGPFWKQAFELVMPSVFYHRVIIELS